MDLFSKYHCDIGVGDLGYGVNQIKLIQDGGYGIDTGEQYDGVGDNNFVGCRSVSDFTKPFQIFDDTIDEHGEQTGRVQIDKTWAVDQLIESMEKVVSHPVYPYTDSKKRPKLMIPSRNDYEISFLLNDIAGITRKDLKILEDSVLDPRQRPRKEYNHPPDSVMAVIYALVSFKVKEESEWYWISA